jgi:enamine deaminase RidA (YjgF/YER057c/UK114 family)
MEVSLTSRAKRRLMRVVRSSARGILSRAQFSQVIRNLKTAAESVGGRPDQYAALTIYITDLQAYLNHKQLLGGAYREVFGKHFPAITMVQVSSLYNPDCMLEISGTVVIE